MPVRIIFTAALLWWSQVSAQPLLQPNPVIAAPLGVKQGLSQGMTNCIYQDKEGYLWIGTKDGLNRYDGYTITTYRTNPNEPYSLPDNFCNKMLEDDNGNFWVGTNSKGLYLFNKIKEQFYPVPFINNNTADLCIRNMQYAGGLLYVQTWSNELMADISRVHLNIQGSEAGIHARVVFNYNQSPVSKRIPIINGAGFGISWIPGKCFWIDRSDSIFWLQPEKNFSEWTIKAYTPEQLGLASQKKWAAAFFPVSDRSDEVVVADQQTIAHFNRTSKTVFSRRTLPGWSADWIVKYYLGNDFNIYAFHDSMVYIYKPSSRSLENFTIEHYGFSNAQFNYLLTDVNAIKWFGTAGYGLLKRDSQKQKFKSYQTQYSGEIFWRLPSNEMPHIPYQKWQAYDIGINKVALDKQGVYWAFLNRKNDASATYLLSYDTHTGASVSYPSIPGTNGWNCNIYNDPQDRIWIYLHSYQRQKNRICRVDKNTGKVAALYSIPEDIDTPDQFVSQFYLDKSGMLWLATINGLYALNEKTGIWKHWKNIPGNNKSLSSDKLLCICPDPTNPDQYLWIGTEGTGFNHFDIATANCIRYDEKDGLPNNVAYSILSDNLNNLWISTNKGLSCFNPDKKTFRNFTDEDGLPGNEFNRYTYMRMPNGKLMFGGVDGFVIFNPKDVLQKQSPVHVAFTGLTIANKPVNWKQDSNVLQQPIAYAKTISLQPGQNIFTISFASLEYRDNSKKMYQFRLKGFDKDWSIPTNRNEATYTNLYPGTYTFFVKGANTDGVWNEKPISIEIVILPHWYQTWWFMALIAVLISAGLYGFYRYRLSQALKIEKIRNRIATDLHDDIGSNLSSILLFSEAAKKVVEGNEKAISVISKINTNATQVMEAMSDIVWAINTRNDHLDNMINRMRSFAVQLSESKGFELHFTDNKNLPEMPLNMAERKNLYLIFKEAINNACKYADCTNLWVSFSSQHGSLVMVIKDDGLGFDTKAQNMNMQKKQGGNGLYNMHKRAADLKGVLTIDSSPGSGTMITFCFSQGKI